MGVTKFNLGRVKGQDGEGVPVGGTTGQRLSKASNGDFDTVWVDSYRLFTATISATWTGSANNFQQTITLTGITTAMTPVIDAALSDNEGTAKAQLEAWRSIGRIVTGNNQITVHCYEDTAPVTAIPIQLLVVM